MSDVDRRDVEYLEKLSYLLNLRYFNFVKKKKKKKRENVLSYPSLWFPCLSFYRLLERKKKHSLIILQIKSLNIAYRWKKRNEKRGRKKRKKKGKEKRKETKKKTTKSSFSLSCWMNIDIFCRSNLVKAIQFYHLSETRIYLRNLIIAIPLFTLIRYFYLNSRTLIHFFYIYNISSILLLLLLLANFNISYTVLSSSFSFLSYTQNTLWQYILSFYDLC